MPRRSRSGPLQRPPRCLSCPARSSPSASSYDYAAKYLDLHSADRAPLPTSRRRMFLELQELAVAAPAGVRVGMARVDLLLGQAGGALSGTDQHHPRVSTISMIPSCGGLGAALPRAARPTGGALPCNATGHSPTSLGGGCAVAEISCHKWTDRTW